MADLRTEIKEAFDKEQSAFPPPPAMRHEVVHTVVSGRQGTNVDARQQPNLQWVAVAAAILITIAIVAGLMSVRLAQRPVPGRPSPAPPTPSALQDYGTPPAGVALIYLIDPRNYAWLQGYDWQGHPRGTVKLPQPLDRTLPSLGMTPDGSGFVNQQAKGTAVEYFDRLGRPIPPGVLPDVAGNVSEMWADDNRHRCFVRFDTPSGEWRLVTKVPGQADQPVAVIATDPNIGQTTISLAACSFRNDVTVLVRTTVSWVSEVWIMRLSDHSVFAHHTYPANALATVVASRDGSYVAENSMAFTNSPNPQGALVNQIRRVSDWSVVATLGTTGPDVLGFSGDDSLVLTANLPMTQGQPSHLGLLNWRSGSELWHYDGPEQLGSLLVQPDGHDFAISLVVVPPQPSPCGNTPQTACHYGPPDSLRDVVIVHGSGSTTRFAGSYVTLW